MEEKKEFKIINQEKYNHLQGYSIFLKVAAAIIETCITSVVAVSDYLYSKMSLLDLIDGGPKKLVISFIILLHSILGISIVKTISLIRNVSNNQKDLKYYYNNATDKDNIEIPNELYERLHKM